MRTYSVLELLAFTVILAWLMSAYVPNTQQPKQHYAYITSYRIG